MRYAVSFLLLALTGCAGAIHLITPGVTTADYSRPTTRTVTNEIRVAKGIDNCWDLFVAEVSKSFFVINNIERDSKIVNLSFSSETPEDYIDCGEVLRTYKSGTRDTTTYEYRYGIAEGSRYFTDRKTREGSSMVSYYDITREASLSGRVNIHMTADGDGTIVTVTTRYVFTSTTGGTVTVRNIAGGIYTSGPVGPEIDTVSLDSLSPGVVESWDGTEIECVSNGTLEEMILAMTKGE